MLANFGLVHDIMKATVTEMLERLGIGIQKDTLGRFPNEGKGNFLYPAFEIFWYLLFLLDYFVATYQEEKLRKPLFNFIADKMLETLDIKLAIGKRIFDITLNKRMEEYGGILVDWNAGEITYDLRNKKLLQGFLDNLTYSISEQDFFHWEGKGKPLPCLDANKCLIIHIIYKEMLLPVEIRFRVMLKNLFTASSDFTQLSTKELEKFQENATKEIEELSL